MKNIVFALNLTLVIVAAILIVVALSPPTLVAKSADPEVEPCKAVNTFGNMTIARCEPEYGVPYYVNTAGFMMLEE